MGAVERQISELGALVEEENVDVFIVVEVAVVVLVVVFVVVEAGTGFSEVETGIG